MLSWFGGIPIFYFYAPLPFWLMALVAAIFPFFSSILIFKWFILLELSFTSAAFYFFVRSFFPDRKSYASLSLFFCLAYLFYQPYEYGSLGIGIAGAIPVGLFAETLATSFVLIFLGFFKRFLEKEEKNIFSFDFLGALIFGTLIVYSHILSIIFAAFFAALIFLFYWSRANIKKLLRLILGLIITCAYALYPLFVYLGFSSGWRMDNKGYFNDPLAPLLGFDLSNLTLGNYLNFNWVWFIIFAFFLFGLIRLLKARQFILPALFLIAFTLVPRQYLQMIFPTLPIHYYRIMPLIMLIYLLIQPLKNG